MLTAFEVHTSIVEAAKAPNTEVRSGAGIPIGKGFRQGDVYLIRVRNNHPRGAKRDSNQLANGVSTGSRHVAEAPAICYDGTTAPPGALAGLTPLLGPCVVSPAPFRVSHPTHPDYVDCDAGVWQVILQLDSVTGEAASD